MSNVLILIPAAGASRRMGGRDKLLEQIDGTPILARQTRRALQCGADVLVTVPLEQGARGEVLRGLACPALTICPVDGREGMAASLRCGAARALAQGYRGMMILPADMPDLDRTDLCHVLCAFRGSEDQVHRATSADGRPGHPVIFPSRMFGGFADLQGDIGARAMLKQEQPVLIPLPGAHALTDLDTPDDWVVWYKTRPPSG